MKCCYKAVKRFIYVISKIIGVEYQVSILYLVEFSISLTNAVFSEYFPPYGM